MMLGFYRMDSVLQRNDEVVTDPRMRRDDKERTDPRMREDDTRTGLNVPQVLRQAQHDNEGAGVVDSHPAFGDSLAWRGLFSPDTDKVEGESAVTLGIAVTYGKNIARPDEIEVVELFQVINQMKSDKLLSLISKIRGNYYSYGEALRPGAQLYVPSAIELFRNKYQALKRKLPWFCMATFSTSRKSGNLVSITGLIIDIDHVKNPEGLLAKIRDLIPEAHFAFRSPTDGVKIVFAFLKPLWVKDDADKLTADFKYIYEIQADKVEKALGVSVDRQCNDPTRACFLSWDRCAVRRNAYIDAEKILRERRLQPDGPSDSSGFDDENRLKTVDLPNKFSVPDDDFEKARQVVSGLAQISFEYKDFVKVGMALYAGFGERGKALWMILKDNPNYSDNERSMNTHWRSFHSVKSIKLATLFYIGDQYGIHIN